MNKTQVKIAILTEAYELIENEEDWTQGSNARDINDNEVEPTDVEACKFCLNGAIRAAGESWPSIKENVEALEEVENSVKQEIIKRQDPIRYTNREILHNKAVLHEYLNGLSPFSNMVDYNDHPTRTHKDILDILSTVLNKLKGDTHDTEA